ncbi:LEAF RUST 10 DISEASE-RESISTANCE LOCUS RECEPTOR-LIKE PROTEIN KINASE-like 2.1 [Impatiens glandulifera]|uniref:LEAF RUST 10 DISEASE-RESISTANCE LOCUS RECEPTOR-LIKE PROTEIN KINASE-like 2.1 n=1 Tax=Impatiens glandulifera TaxID=253017 RepID=UPI001FB09D50|nr:LEAF RUST 10 DISEASE-RESISTANCE LOCUS RECEPTOR-LIKE PROTEIN KINASE-like 2.1 [Impatiens glandulifera]
MINSNLLALTTFFFAAAADSSDASCKPSMCGNVSISYPFWNLESPAVAGAGAFHCGYPGFGVDCSSDNRVLWNLSRASYYVENINYTDYSFRFIDADLNQTCPRARHNISIENLPLEFTRQNLNVTFYFNCSGLMNQSDDIECMRFNDKKSFVFVKGSQPHDMECDEVVEVAVVDRDFGIAESMNRGFGLNWMHTADCNLCKESDGQCGLNKLSNGTQSFSCLCQNNSTNPHSCLRRGMRNSFQRLLLGILGGIAPGLLLLLCFCYCWRKMRWGGISNSTRDDEQIELFIRNHETMFPTRYSYSDIKRITNSFREKLGKGGYGTVYKVYKGQLLGNDNSLVAVKILNETKESGEDFVNEVSSISRTSHVNIVNLLGFCLDRGKRALIYEYMPNGSLDKFIHNDFVLLDKWERLRQIATGIARGLEYLHLGCNTRILHFDIKPQNILLDENLNPKISDFGLAKMCSNHESIVSMLGARGTIGYIAPEIVSRSIGPVSYKSDVYSYGMLVLEMVGVLKNTNNEKIMDESSEIYFPHWVHKHLEEDNIVRLLQRDDVTIEESNIAKKIILVGLWCTQTEPSRRPHMSKVVEMLEGRLETVQFPPNPNVLSSTSLVNSPPNNSLMYEMLESFMIAHFSSTT